MNHDQWITTNIHESGCDLEEVQKHEWREWDKESRLFVPIMIDEMACDNCNGDIGWSSDGTFGSFWTDPNERVFVCEDCTDEIRANWFGNC